MKFWVVSWDIDDSERDVVPIYKRDVVEHLVATNTSGKIELSKSYRSFAL